MAVISIVLNVFLFVVLLCVITFNKKKNTEEHNNLKKQVANLQESLDKYMVEDNIGVVSEPIGWPS